MPYQVQQSGSRYCVHKKMPNGEMGKKMGCHGSKAEAMAQMRALYANEGDKKEIDAIDLELKELGLDAKEIQTMTDKCMGEMGMYVPWGIKSFDELDAWRDAQKVSKEVADNTYAFQRIVENIMEQFDVGLNEKMAAVRELADEFASRVDNPEAESKEAANPPEVTTEPPPDIKGHSIDSIVSAVFDKVKGLFGLSSVDKEPDGFMTFKEADGSYKWVARYSNHYRDQDNPPEIIASASHQSFVDKVEKGLAPLPELWIWHVKEWRIGKADWVTYDPDSGFAIAGGRSLPGAEPVFEAMSHVKSIKVSHGMPKSTIVRDQADDTIIVEHETREISPLPGWAAANKLTGFAVLDSENKEANMAIPADKRDKLIKEWGISDDILSKIEAANTADSQKATDEGLEHKEAETVTATVTTSDGANSTVTTVNVGVTEIPAEPPAAEPPAQSKEMYESLNPVFAEIVAQFKALNERLDAMEKKQADAQEAVNKAIGQTPAASILSMFDGLGKSAIGADSTRVDGRTELAKSKPAETKTEVKGSTFVPFLNDILAGQPGQQ